MAKIRGATWALFNKYGCGSKEPYTKENALLFKSYIIEKIKQEKAALEGLIQ